MRPFYTSYQKQKFYIFWVVTGAMKGVSGVQQKLAYCKYLTKSYWIETLMSFLGLTDLLQKSAGNVKKKTRNVQNGILNLEVNVM